MSEHQHRRYGLTDNEVARLFRSSEITMRDSEGVLRQVPRLVCKSCGVYVEDADWHIDWHRYQGRQVWPARAAALAEALDPRNIAPRLRGARRRHREAVAWRYVHGQAGWGLNRRERLLYRIERAVMGVWGR